MIEKNQIKNCTVLNDVLEKSQENPEIPENYENNYLPCDKCQSSEKNEATFSFSCLHNICVSCLFNYFIQNKFKGLKLEFISFNCPICQYGNAKFSLETWINILNQIFLRENMKNGKANKKSNKKILCNMHKNNECIKYCYQCKKNLCEQCEKYHNNHMTFDINNSTFFQMGQFVNEDDAYKNFEENMRKKENVFYEKIENDYILKKIKIEELIRKLNLLLNEFTLKMNVFQRNMQNIFHIINISYYLYFNLMKKAENKNKIILNDKLLDIKFISQNTIDLNDLSIYFNKKLNSFDSAINLSDSKDNIDNIESDISKIFNYELIWSESPPKKKFILKEDNSIADSITKIIQLKSDENLIASAQMNGILNIWDLSKKEVEIQLKGHKSAVWALIENSEDYLISGGSDNVIKIWDIQNRKENSLITIKGHKGTIYSICEFEKDKIISGSDDMSIKIWQFNLNNKKNPYQCILNLLDPNNSKIKSLIYIPKSNAILTGNDDNFIKIYSLSNKVQYVTNILEGHSCTVWCLVPFYEDTMLASGSSDNSIRIWDLMNWRCLYSLEGHENTISSLVLLRNEFLGSSSWDCTCKIWNLETRSCIYTLKGHKDIVWSFIELKNGELATCSNDKNIIIWEKN